MISRKRKIFLVQSLLFIFAFFLIALSYTAFNKKPSDKIITEKIKREIDKKIKKNDKDAGNIFYNIEYSGIDLSGNRYILKAKEASDNDKSEDLLNLKDVNAKFYFKNNRILNITSNYGLYNSNSLDMIFEKNVIGKYEESTMLAEKAEYFNSKNFLLITGNVKIKDIRGTILAEKLLFDIEKNKLDISSSEDKKVDAKINYK